MYLSIWEKITQMHINTHPLYINTTALNNNNGIFKCYFSKEHIAHSDKKWCEHGIRENQLIKNTVHDGKSYLK